MTTSIFTPATPAPQPSAAQRAVNQLIGRSSGALRQLATALAQGQQSFWTNPAATPDEQLALLGTQAAEVFQVAALTQKFLGDVLALSPGQKIVQPNNFVAPRAVTINADGTVTLAPAA